MADDDRNRRRLGDATKARIAELASGWDGPPAEPPIEEPASGPARTKPRTQPPPPPGSPMRDKPPTAPPPAPRTTGSSGARAGSTVPATPAARAAADEPVGPTFFGVPVGRPKTPSAPPPPPPRPSRATGSSAIVPSAAASALQAVVARPTPPATTAPLVIASTRAVADPTRPDATDPDTNLPTTPEQALTPDPEELPSAELMAIEPARPVVPLGEFDDHRTQSDNERHRANLAHATVKRDAASALLGIAEPPKTVVRPQPVPVLLEETAHRIKAATPDPEDVVAPGTARFERGDPTTTDPPSAAVERAMTSGAIPGGKLRPSAALRRKRGLGGDARYVFTVLMGVRRARAELADLEARQATRTDERRRHLIGLGRAAVVADLDHPALARTKDALATAEDDRARLDGEVAAADQELARVRREREAAAAQATQAVQAIDGELAELTKKREPLEREAAAIRKRAGELHDSLRKLDASIVATEQSTMSLKSQRLDPAAIRAELATLKADRRAVERDEPVIAAELDQVEPRLAAVDAAQGDARERRAAALAAESADQKRVAELLEAIGARRKVAVRAAADAEAARDRILLALGETLYVDRPRAVTPQLAPVDDIDVELGTVDRRAMELREILSSVDRAKLARGIAFLVLVLALVGGATGYAIYLFA